MENEPASVEMTPQPTLIASSSRSPWQIIATHNPLYAVSAGLVFYGLRASFSTYAAAHSAVLMSCLAAYVLLLATTAVWLRRLGTLWEDVRMLALLVLLLLLGISVTFDATLLAHPRLGTGYFLGGWLFAVVVCEGLLHGLRVQLPLSYRGPFHALLALFFLYPLGAAEFVVAEDESALSWYLFGFVPAASLILLTLLPAVWRGPRLVAENGTPWRWPLYPGALFAFLVLAVVGRANYLCYSFSIAPDGQTVFGVYFLIPLAWTVSLLTLVVVRRHGSVESATRLLVLPLGWLALTNVVASKMSYDPTYARFLKEWMETLGCGPAAIAVLATVAFYGIAWMLRVPSAFGCLIAALTAASFVHGPARSALDLQPAVAAPFLVAVMLVWIVGLLRRDVRLCCFGSGMLTMAVAVWSLRHDNVPVAFATYHAAVASLLLIGMIFYGQVGSGVRAAVVGMLLLSGTNAILSPYDGLFAGVPGWATYYPWLAMVAMPALAYLFQDSIGYVATIVLLGEWCGIRGWGEYVRLRRYVPGLDAIVLGMLAFAAAVGVSLSKSRHFEQYAPQDEPPSGPPI